MKKTLWLFAALCLASTLASAQSPDTTHSIRMTLPLGEARVYRGVLDALLANNMTVIGQSPNAIFASPIEAPNASIRIMLVGSPTSTEIMISEVLAKSGGGFTFQGTGSSSGGFVEAVDNGGNKFWKRLEELVATLRAMTP